MEEPEPQEFARAINTLLDQPELRERLGAAGRRKMETTHDIRKTRELWTGLFDQGTSRFGLFHQPVHRDGIERQLAVAIALKDDALAVGGKERSDQPRIAGAMPA